MNCAKCGREVTESTPFCSKCQAEMDRHPIPPGATVQLPQRGESSVKKAPPKRKKLSSEEQILMLRKQLRRQTTRLYAALLALTLALLALCYTTQELWMPLLEDLLG